MKTQRIEHEENTLLEEPEVPWRIRYLIVLTRCMLVFSVIFCIWFAIFRQELGGAVMFAAMGYVLFAWDRLLHQ